MPIPQASASTEAHRRANAAYQASPKGKIAARRCWLKYRYGLTLDQYDAMLAAAQEGRCAICGTDEPGGRRGVFCVDHNHLTGKVRQLLCWTCNRRLGVLEMHDWVQKATAYLARHARNW